jgi:hypothetical protein
LSTQNTDRWLGIQELGDVAEAHLIRRASASIDLARLVEQAKSAEPRSDEYVRQRVALARALYDSGKLTKAEYVMHAVQPVEYGFESRWSDHHDNPTLTRLADQMHDIEKRYGLAKNEYWTIDTAPAEYQALSAEYDRVADALFGDALERYGLNEVAELWRNDRREYDALREGGRRRIFEAENVLAAVSTCIDHFEQEAQQCYTAAAYYASCIMIGAAAEGRLLLRCLQDPAQTEAARARLRGRGRPHTADPLEWRLDDLINVAEEAGWLRLFESEDFVFNTKGLLHHLRLTRNLLHSGRHARDKPHVLIGKDAHDDAEAAYKALVRSLSDNVTNEGEARPTFVS